MRLPIFCLLLVTLFFSSTESMAQTQSGCKSCHLPFTLWQHGTGFARDQSEICPACKKKIEEFKDKFHLWFFGELNENRYLHFKDGTIIDLKHYRGSMILAVAFNYVLPDVVPGVSEGSFVAYAVGWGIEKHQQNTGHPSGHPGWTNEDMLSNTMGIAFVHSSYVPGISEWTWSRQTIGFLEQKFGALEMVSDKDPNKKKNFVER